MEESTKKKLHQFEIMAAVLLLLVSVVSFFPNTGITGFVSIESKKQEIDLSIANSQSYILTTNSIQPIYLTSLKLSGNVVGDGIAKAYITTENQKILIYSNIIRKDQGLDTITGMKGITGGVVGVDSETEGSETEKDYLIIEHLENIEEDLGTIADDEMLTSGTFQDICIDSCFIEMLLKPNTIWQTQRFLLHLTDLSHILQIHTRE